jgi:tape measure domain-containing protein
MTKCRGADEILNSRACPRLLAFNVKGTTMTDQKLIFTIDGDASGLKKAIAEAQAANRQMIDALTRKVGDIGTFKTAQEQLAKLNVALVEAKRRRDFFINSASSGGAAGTKLFAADIARAKQEVLNLAAAAQKQQARLAALSPTLKAAGIDTRNLAAADARLAGEMRAANAATSAQVTAMQKAHAQSVQVKRGLAGMETGAAKLRAAFGPLIATFAAGFSVRGLAQAADQYANLQARLKLAARSQEEFNASNAAIRRIASAAQVPLSETAQLYTRIANSLKDTDVAQSQFVDTTEAVALALRLSGASVAEQNSAMLQFSQSIASGVLRGEEFNAVAEAAPRLLQALAHSLNKPVGELRAMAKEGQLTRDVLINGLAAELPTLRREAESLPGTLAASFTEMGNRVLVMVGKIDQAAGASASLAKAMLEMGTPAIRTVFETLAVLAANLAFVFKATGREIGAVAAQIAAILRGDFKGARFIRDAVTADAKAARAELDALEKKILGLSSPEIAPKPVAGALKEFADVSDARLKLEARQAAEIKRIKDGETETIKLAVDAQIAAVKKSRDALRDSEKDLADIAKKTAAFQQELAKAGQAEGERSLLDVAGDVGKVRQALAGGDAKGALEQIDVARAGMLELIKSGKEAPLFLQSFARELGQLALAAGEQQRAAAEDNMKQQEAKLVYLQSLAKEIENINITANVDAAEKEMQNLHARTQAFYDANPLVMKVVAERQADIALGVEKAPKKAGGGPISGPGTGTSDSILIRASNGEFIVRAAAVKRLGMARLREINQGRIPAFAQGGAISSAAASVAARMGAAMRAPVPDYGARISRDVLSSMASPIPAYADGGAVESGHSSVVNLSLPFGDFEMRATESVAAELRRAVRVEALKHGRRR